MVVRVVVCKTGGAQISRDMRVPSSKTELTVVIPHKGAIQTCARVVALGLSEIDDI